MIEYTKLIERLGERYGVPELSTDQLLNRRDRKRRNQRITAGVVGIAVFVAAVWIVTSGGVFDRSETSVVPGGDVTGPAETGPAETGPPPARAASAPDVVRTGPCSGGSTWRLELTDYGPDEIQVRFKVGGAAGHRWRFVLRHGRAGPDSFDHGDGRVFFEGTRDHPACCSPDLWVHARVGNREGDDGFAAKAVDQQTGQVCKALGVIQE